jgi:hypothetical protein
LPVILPGDWLAAAVLADAWRRLTMGAMRDRRFFVAAVLPPVVLAHLAVGVAVLAEPAVQPVPPAPPRVFLDTSYHPPSGQTIAVRAGGDLQAALNAARLGDVITLEPGAVFQGNFALRNKTGSGWLIVRSGAPDDRLPAPGARVTPAFTPVMPKILSPNQNPALYTEPGAHHYRFIGIEFSTTPDVKTIYSIVAFGGTQESDTDTPHDLILDRSYVHGHSGLTSQRGVLLNSASAAVIDSHVSEIHAPGSDAQAILGYNGPGPFKIVNNFLEGATENIMFGGADPKIPGLVPSDIEIRRNHIFKPLSWLPDDPNFAGVKWPIKNLLELKNAQRVLIEGNLLENNTETALVLTPRNQSGSAPWSVVQDVLIRNNLVRNSGTGFVALFSDSERSSQPMKRVAIVNNLWQVRRTFFALLSGPGVLEDLLIEHNTAVPCAYSTYLFEARVSPALIRFRLTNNVAGFGAYGVVGGGADSTLAQVAPAAIVSKNALINLGDSGDGQGEIRNVRHGVAATMYMAFRNAASAGINADGTLAPTSPLRRGATDGKDIGVDFDELQRALRPQPVPG